MDSFFLDSNEINISHRSMKSNLQRHKNTKNKHKETKTKQTKRAKSSKQNSCNLS